MRYTKSLYGHKSRHRLPILNNTSQTPARRLFQLQTFMIYSSLQDAGESFMAQENVICTIRQLVLEKFKAENWQVLKFSLVR